MRGPKDLLVYPRFCLRVGIVSWFFGFCLAMAYQAVREGGRVLNITSKVSHQLRSTHAACLKGTTWQFKYKHCKNWKSCTSQFTTFYYQNSLNICPVCPWAWKEQVVALKFFKHFYYSDSFQNCDFMISASGEYFTRNLPKGTGVAGRLQRQVSLDKNLDGNKSP